MMPPVSINLCLISNAFFRKTGAGDLAVSVFRDMAGRGSPSALSDLLRAHRTKPVSEKETFVRDAFDMLLGGYSMLEVASMCGEVPEALPSDLVDTAATVLNHDAVATYFGEHYPTPLVEAFRRRISGQPIVTWGSFKEWAEFPRFYEYSLPVDTNGPLETFLWFLDDGERGGWDLSHTLKAIRSPESTARCLAVGKDKNPKALSVRGLMEFVEFCTAFDAFLQAIAGSRVDGGSVALLQSVYWHYHAYWFSQLADKVGVFVLGKALPHVASWRKSAIDDDDTDELSAQEWSVVDEYLQSSLGAVRRLINPDTFGRPFRATMANLGSQG